MLICAAMDNELLLGQNVAFLVDVQKVMKRGELAEKIGVSEANIGQLIRNENKGLRPLNLVRAARALNYSVEDLVCVDLRSQNELMLREAGVSYLPATPITLARRAADLLTRKTREGEPGAANLAKAVLAFFGD
jgi:DNA-binding Xre family transcriptional regulator